MRNHIALPIMFMALMTVATAPAPAETARPSQTPKAAADLKPIATADFVKKASMGDMYEIETSKIVLDDPMATDPAKEFAQQTIRAHTDIANDMKEALAASGTRLAPATTLDSEKAAKLNTLKSLQGEQLSNAYLMEMSNFHDKAVMLYSTYSMKGDNPQLKQFAMATLPTVQAHNEHLKGLSLSK